ncbi:MAG: amino acid adenylation domain-containing protein [Clostridiales bacterium]|nr:amino acid adenylation domain-containing protein [Clostridiales bacterium]
MGTMQYNILEYLDDTVRRVPEKVAYSNEKSSVTFQQTHDRGRAIGTFLSNKGIYKEPVVVFMSRGPEAITAFYGAVYGGNYYVPLDEEMPRFRIELIMEKLDPRVIICDDSTKGIVDTFDYSGSVYLYNDIIKTPVNEDMILEIRKRAIDTDPIYVVFTSGSTGIPKGVVACHRSVIDYIETLSDVLEFSEKTVFGNQTPLYFDACLKELYPTLKFGATTYLIPKNLFMFPIKLVEYLNDKKINTICWVVSALTMISAFGVLDKVVPQYLETIAFGSEVFPIKQFNLWRNALPDTKFINLYGPTEATGMSCYYKIDRDFKEDEAIPIGAPFKNTEIILLDDKNRIPDKGDMGEICIRGTSLTLGYYKDFDRTNEVFVQNPLNSAYPELIYRTGDLGKYNERGELVFVSRRDQQIKHMGHRIELGEIEFNVNMVEGVKAACCIYNKDNSKIELFYVGDISTRDLSAALKKRLPRYMVPNYIKALDEMPLTANKKIDRLYIKQNLSRNKRGK